MLVGGRYTYGVDRDTSRLDVGLLWVEGEPLILPNGGLPTRFSVADLQPVVWPVVDDNRLA